MQPRKQFHVGQHRRPFFERKVLHYGYSRTVALGKVIPEDWKYVRITILHKDKGLIELSITRLLGDEPIAQNTKTHQTNRQDP